MVHSGDIGHECLNMGDTKLTICCEKADFWASVCSYFTWRQHHTFSFSLRLWDQVWTSCPEFRLAGWIPPTPISTNQRLKMASSLCRCVETRLSDQHQRGLWLTGVSSNPVLSGGFRGRVTKIFMFVQMFSVFLHVLLLLRWQVMWLFWGGGGGGHVRVTCF